jgi:hypothetical protein
MCPGIPPILVVRIVRQGIWQITTVADLAYVVYLKQGFKGSMYINMLEGEGPQGL